MLRSMSARQLQEWIAFAELEPFDETRQDIRTAAIQATLAEINRDHERRRRPFTWMDFKFPFGDEPQMETPMSMAQLQPAKTSAELKFMAMMIVADSAAKEQGKRRG